PEGGQRRPRDPVRPAEEGPGRPPHPRPGARRCRVSDQDWAAELVEPLTALAGPDNPNRAALAHLRRGRCGPPDYTLARARRLFRSVPDLALEHAVLAARLLALVQSGPHMSDG